jgi:hypothetical protein
MTAHEKALKTYEALQKRKELKKQQELQHKLDINATGWNGYTKHMVTNLKRYY